MLLTDAELHLLADAELFRIRRSIEVKISDLFAQLKLRIEPLVAEDADWLPKGCLSSGKVSRGERHNGFPWMALDYPATFERDASFTFRTVLIWGHHFSFHLLLTGKWLHHFRDAVSEHAHSLQHAGFQKSLADTPWDWTRDAFGDLHTPGAGDGTFLKLTHRMSLQEYALLPERGAELYSVVRQCLRPR